MAEKKRELWRDLAYRDKDGKVHLRPLPAEVLASIEVEDDIPWPAVKQAISILMGYGFFGLTKSDLEDASRCELSKDQWQTIKEALLEAGAYQEGRYLNLRDLEIDELP